MCRLILGDVERRENKMENQSWRNGEERENVDGKRKKVNRRGTETNGRYVGRIKKRKISKTHGTLGCTV